MVVTGGSRGIGRGIALAFACEGAQTVLASSSAKNLADAVKAIAQVGPEPLTVEGDLRQLAGCEQLLARVKERFGRCDILVNNAGRTRAGNFLELPDEAFFDGFALKYHAAMRLTRLFWPLLKASQGHLVNIVGGAARSPEPEFTIGSSVNAALANASKGLSKLGMRDGINVNVIHPGNTRTERQEELLAQRAQATGKPVEELRARPRWQGPASVVSARSRTSRRLRCSCARARAPHPRHGDCGRWRGDRRVLLRLWPRT